MKIHKVSSTVINGKRITTLRLDRIQKSELIQFVGSDLAIDVVDPSFVEAVAQVTLDPAVPTQWPSAESQTDVDKTDRSAAMKAWIESSRVAVDAANDIVACGVSESVAMRVLESYLRVTITVTGDDAAFKAFFAQAMHGDKPYVQLISTLMRMQVKDQAIA